MSKVKIATLVGLTFIGAVAYQNRQPLMDLVNQPQATLPVDSEDTDTQKRKPLIRPRRPRHPRITNYHEAYQYALKNKLNMIIWVNHEDTELENKLTGCLHFHTNKFESVSADKAIVVGKLKDNEFMRYDVSLENANYATIKSLLDN